LKAKVKNDNRQHPDFLVLPDHMVKGKLKELEEEYRRILEPENELGERE